MRFVNSCEEILATSRLDAETYPAADFKACFHWNSLYFLLAYDVGLNDVCRSCDLCFQVATGSDTKEAPLPSIALI
jgi:hypothetical protein